MASISASTTHKMVKKTAPKSKTVGKSTKGKAAARRGSRAPPLTPATLRKPESIEALKNLDEDAKKDRIVDILRLALGEQRLGGDRSKPHSASTTRDRAGAAADLAVAAKEVGTIFVLKKCEVLATMQRMLFPDGLGSLFSLKQAQSTGLRPSTSAVSLASMDDTTVTSIGSGGTDSKRGKSTPPNAREGSLMVIRALCQIVGKPAEPYIVSGFLAAALDECGSSSSAVREAAEDTATAIVALASPWAFPKLISPMLVQSLASTEWRVKFNALERIAQCAETSPQQVNHLLPLLIPEITGQVWDTKAQVTKAAASTLLAICKTCKNPDVSPALPAVVHAICKPSETVKAVQELMGTTFIAPVDAATLSILCPVLARALKEKLAINKRAACLVIKNMSRLVENPQAVAPFGPLLVPELQKVATNVQFEEIRDAALSALSNLTKALGDMYDEDAAKKKAKMEAETARIEAEQDRIEQEKLAEQKKQEEINRQEEEERRKFKEAMDAQRELDKIEEEKARKEKIEEMKKKDKQMRSTKSAGGKCQACGLKKCKKSCMFFGS